LTSQQRRRLLETRGTDTHRKERLWVRDAWREFDVFQVPVEALLLNVENRRFFAERKLLEEKLGHELDPENSSEDEQIVESMLLDSGLEVDGNKVSGKPGKDYFALLADWRRRRQETAFWIRPDGLVRNGNRRLAMLRRLQRELGLEGSKYADAIILDPSDIDEVALFEMEQREQLTENLKVRYTDINLLLAIREAATARAIDWFDPESLETVAGQIQHVVGNDRGYALVQLNAIKYMDAYLADSNQSHQYHKLIGQIERFRDVGRAMARIEADYPDDAPEVLRLLFAAIRAGLPHGKIRDLRRMFRNDRERYLRLLTNIDGIEADWERPAETIEIGTPEVIHPIEDGEIEGDNEDSEPPGPNVPNYPQLQIATAIEDALDGFLASLDDDILKTLRQVCNRLDILTLQREHLSQAVTSSSSTEVREALQAIVDWAARQRSLLEET
jgi:hypothetical protein